MRESDDHPPLAHSPPREDMDGDPYVRHVHAVRTGAIERAEAILRNASNPPSGLLDAISTAATFHDLGKLDPDNQDVLRKGRGYKLKWDHIDAGVAHSSAEQDCMAAWLIRAHHAPGLPRKVEHFDADHLGRRLRGRRHDDSDQQRHTEQIKRTDSLLESSLREHELAVGSHRVGRRHPSHGLTMRLALSCLVDADYADTAFYDTGQVSPCTSNPRWAERLDSLCNYVQALPEGDTEEERARNRRRRAFFTACLDSGLDDPMVACEAPVGLGKTTAVTAFLLRRALDKGLRRLIIVAPFTNILTQTTRVLRKALVLEGEQADRVIVEHHHRADFEDEDGRAQAILWRAPIILTTAVSFFETLAACDPATLRKLHAVPGSAIFLDEAHASLPTKLWPQNWKWLCKLANDWGCCLVFASGSLVRFWEDREIIDPPTKLPELMPGDQERDVLTAERRRVVFTSVSGGRVLEVGELIKRVTETQGPRLVILNTVQNAAVVAKAMRAAGIDALHLSTALTPCDRELIMKRVERRLQFKGVNDWVFVATSCVEAGVDLSFRCAFRERFSAASIIQVGGRVNRHGEYDEFGGGTVHDFALYGKGITQHPAAAVSADVLHSLMGENMFGEGNPADVVTEAMRRELSAYGGLGVDLLLKAEAERDYPAVKKLGRVIDADTRLVVIDPNIVELLTKRSPVGFRELLYGSVQLWSNRIDKLGLAPLHRHGEIYAWNDVYDPDFLGYMAGVLRNEEFMRDNEAWVI